MIHEFDYGKAVEVAQPMNELRPTVEALLKEEGFGILTEIDVKATLKQKLDIDVPGQLILGACNPPFAHQALATEPDLGIMLPCNVVLRELPNGGTRVSVMDTVKVMGMVDNPGLVKIGAEVGARLDRVLEMLPKD